MKAGRCFWIAGDPRTPLTGPFRPAWCLVALSLLAACSTGTNDELVASPTPYPVRSPIATPAAGARAPASPVAAAMATGEAARRAGDAARAVAAFDRAVTADPANAAARIGRSAARADAGDLAGARTDADAAIAADPNLADLYVLRADVASRLADFGAADEDYRRGIALDPSEPEAFIGRGEVARLLAQGDLTRYQRALDDFTRALALDPRSATARLGRARVFVDRAAFRGDVADLDRALAELDAMPPGEGGAAVGLVRARVLAARGDLDGARRIIDAPVIRRLDEPVPDIAERQDVRAAVAYAAREWDAAAAAARAAIAADATSWEAHRVLAGAELRRGDAAAALAATDIVLARWTDDGPSLYVRGLALLALGRDREGREALDRARRRLAASPVYQARIDQALAGT